MNVEQILSQILIFKVSAIRIGIPKFFENYIMFWFRKDELGCVWYVRVYFKIQVLILTRIESFANP